MNKKGNIVFDTIRFISKLGELACEICLVALALMVFREVVARYVFKSPSVFSVEISEYMMIFIAFLSAGWVLHQDRHVNMTALTDRFSPRIRLYLEIITSTITMAYCSIIIWKSVTTVWMAYNGGYHSASSVNFPLWIAYSFIPLGISILFLQYIVKVGDSISSLMNLSKGN